MSRSFVCPHCYETQDKPSNIQEKAASSRMGSSEFLNCVSCRQGLNVIRVARGDYDVSQAGDVSFAVVGILLFPLFSMPLGAVIHGILYVAGIDVMAWGGTKLFGYMIPNYYLTVAAIAFCFALFKVLWQVSQGNYRKTRLKSSEWNPH